MNKKLKHGVFIFSLILTLAVLCGCEKLSEKSTPFLINNAASFAASGKWEKALKYSDAVVTREPTNVDALLLKAISSEHLGKMPLALKAAREAVTQEPDRFAAQYTLGRLYAKDPKKMQDAVAPLLRALKLKANDQNTLILLAKCSTSLKLANAIKYYQMLAKYPRFKKRPELFNQMGIYYAVNKQNRKAAENLVSAYQMAPNNPIILLNFAIFKDLYIGMSDNTVDFYKQYLKITANNPELQKKRDFVKSRIEQITSK
ncbi:tetratricopeptide repeat protein [Lentisphaerota bacterium ZTH]|nr:tetratricopeptide repeat protein [Lentisphaerota bacterium]WET05107.1 tetratricopeptide repeat protein [Lentisphaerota bacterium ZTH]